MSISSNHEAGHTAGVFTDKTANRPEIGTLVVVVDRARNLPNRKTIGKQDPYCSMKLAKEARKTKIDRRGGQTPRWDDELRFIVHDSQEHDKLKCSIFNEDKKNNLVGEAWIDLTNVLKAGGGQSDLWQQLNNNGRYAGELRVELTFYDFRNHLVCKKKGQSILQEHSEIGKNFSAFESSFSDPRKIRPRNLGRRPLSQTTMERKELQANRILLLPRQLENKVLHKVVEEVPTPMSAQSDSGDGRIRLDVFYNDRKCRPHLDAQNIAPRTKQKRQSCSDKCLRNCSHVSESSSAQKGPIEQVQLIPLPSPTSCQDAGVTPLDITKHIYMYTNPTAFYNVETAEFPTPAKTLLDRTTLPHDHVLSQERAHVTNAPGAGQDSRPKLLSQFDTCPPEPPKHRHKPWVQSRGSSLPPPYKTAACEVVSKMASSRISRLSQLIVDNMDAQYRQVDGSISPNRRIHTAENQPHPATDQPGIRDKKQPRLSELQVTQRPQSSGRHGHFSVSQPIFPTQVTKASKEMFQSSGNNRPSQQNPVVVMGRLSRTDPQREAQKAAIDQPESLSSMPFSPESYDVLNPCLKDMSKWLEWML